MAVTEFVKVSVFRKVFGLSYKYENLTIIGRNGVCAGICFSNLQVSTRHVSNRVCDSVPLQEMKVMKSVTEHVFICRLRQSLFLFKLQTFIVNVSDRAFQGVYF